MLCPRQLLGSEVSSQAVLDFIQELASSSKNASTSASKPEIKSYPDVAYHNYYDFGLSLLFTLDGPQVSQDELMNSRLESILVYNDTDINDGSRKAQNSSLSSFSPYPAFPVILTDCPVSTTELVDASAVMQIAPTMTGKDIVRLLGEPSRKGGGTGTLGIWCEWSKHGVMVEFGGIDARGPLSWETGKDAVWSVLTIFRQQGDT